MMNKLWVRLSLGFSGTVLVAAFMMACTSIFIGWLGHRDSARIDSRFWEQTTGPYLVAQAELAAKLTTRYQDNHSWVGSKALLEEAQTIFMNDPGPRQLAFTLANANQTIIYHPHPMEMGRPLAEIEPLQVFPIRVEGQTVGYLGLGWARNPRGRPTNPAEALFALAGTLLVVATVIGFSGAIFGMVMSRSLTAPLNNLVSAARGLATRDFSQRVTASGTDEMRAVAIAFNDMADQLEQAETLRRNLLADVAHELRTPLSVLQGNLRAILDEVYPLEQAEIVRLYDHTRFLSRLVNDLHELAQAEAKKLPLDRQAIDLGQLIKNSVETFQPTAEAKQVALRVELPATLPPISVDAARLRQVLQNLLANALRHTPAGGSITVKAATHHQVVDLTVRDTGEGIPSEHLPHIFDRFYRTDPARGRDRGGAGLGLAIARAIIEAHGGTIQAASLPGQGTQFMIQLPLVVNSSSR